MGKCNHEIVIALLLAACHPAEDSGSWAPVTPLYFAFVIHLEGHPGDSEENHDRRTQVVKDTSRIFEEHDAKVTWEVHDTIYSSVIFDDPYLSKIEARGHGIGVHADLAGGFDDESLTQEQFVTSLEDMRHSLVSQEVTVRHVSGACSLLDWPSAVFEAGYSFYSGGVDYCLMSLPPELRPAGLECERPSECHHLYPHARRARMHPWRADPDNWTLHDETGDLVIMPAMVNAVASLHEDRQPDFEGDARFTKGDIEVLLEELELAIHHTDPERVNTFMVQWSVGPRINEPLLRLLLERIQPYRDDGRVLWSTMPRIYDTYLDWEQGEL